jgi:hypothetical protein
MFSPITKGVSEINIRHQYRAGHRRNAATRRRTQFSCPTESAQDLAQAMMRQEGDANLARARLQAMPKLLTEAERFLTES